MTAPPGPRGIESTLQSLQRRLDIVERQNLKQRFTAPPPEPAPPATGGGGADIYWIGGDRIGVCPTSSFGSLLGAGGALRASGISDGTGDAGLGPMPSAVTDTGGLYFVSLTLLFLATSGGSPGDVATGGVLCTENPGESTQFSVQLFDIYGAGAGGVANCTNTFLCPDGGHIVGFMTHDAAASLAFEAYLSIFKIG